MKRKLHVKTGDEVMVISGKDKGKTGKVVAVSLKEGKVIVEKINISKKHLKPKRQGEVGNIVDVESPMYASKVMLVCPKCSKATRIAHGVDADGNKKRKCKHCDNLF